jgi:fructokinase
MQHRIGIDLGGTKIEIIALDPDGAVLLRHRIATPRDNYAGTLAAVAALVSDAQASLGPALSVGIGTPGTLSRIDGTLKNANSVWLNGKPLMRDLAEILGRDVQLANDANCFALSEAVDGAGTGAEVVFGVIVGTGTGAGIVVNRHILTGPNGIAGEWGHNSLPWPADNERPGPPCYCGLYGCIETFLSGPGLSGDHARATGQTLSAEAIARGAEDGDTGCEASLQRYENRMARALAHVINILDPDVIVLGGGMSNVQRLYQNVPRLWEAYVFSDRVDTLLLPPVHGDSSGVRGAAWLGD